MMLGRQDTFFCTVIKRKRQEREREDQGQTLHRSLTYSTTHVSLFYAQTEVMKGWDKKTESLLD